MRKPCGCPVPEHQRRAETADPLSPAICQEPELLVLDEPTSFLDIRHKLELLDILKKLVHERNVAVLMSLHELDLAERISDYVLCAENGTIGRTGTPREVFEGDYIAKLYGIEHGSYLTSLGFPELPRTGRSAEGLCHRRHGERDSCVPCLKPGGDPLCGGRDP